ncbi:MAG: hypothetical protein IPL89_06340 [Acidobacteria bacterium]|nr:hypothetical protein [Acidobacteriota bacterium]
MPLLAALALVLPFAAAPAPKPTLPPTPPGVAMRMSGLFATATPAVRTWVDGEARKLRPLPRIDGAVVAADARQAFPAARPPLTPVQADLLAAMALYQVANDLDSEARLAGDAAPEKLADYQSRKRGVIETLSNIMSKISTTQDSLVQNVK